MKKQTRELQKLVRGFPRRAGLIYQKHFLDAFDKEAFTDKTPKSWQKRKRADKAKARRNLLVKTGRLRRSIKLQIVRGRAIIQTAVPYAQIHNEGGTITGTANVGAYRKKAHKVRSHTRSGTRIRRHKRRSHTVGAHKRKMNTKIPQRQFMGQSSRVNRRLEKQLEKSIKKIFK